MIGQALAYGIGFTVGFTVVELADFVMRRYRRKRALEFLRKYEAARAEAIRTGQPVSFTVKWPR